MVALTAAGDGHAHEQDDGRDWSAGWSRAEMGRFIAFSASVVMLRSS